MNASRAMSPRRTAALVALLLVAGCRAPLPVTRTMTRSEVYFGLSRPDGTLVSADAFGTFVAAEIAPRFPDGFTILNAQGHWREADGDLVTEESRLLILFTTTPAQARAIDEICHAYRDQFGQEAVLRATSPAWVTFVVPQPQPQPQPATRPAP